jgi:hypothetical protein
MPEYDLSDVDLTELQNRLKALLGEKFIGLSYPPLTMHTTEELKPEELALVKAEVAKHRRKKLGIV